MRPAVKLGMALLLVSESVFFFMLILAFVFFRRQSLAEASANLNLGAAAAYTACLLASSFAAWQATRSSGSRAWLGGAILLGAVFLLGQGSQYVQLLRHGITISQGLFGTTFFTLTGIHALHVLIGIVLLAFTMWAAGPGSGEAPERQGMVEAAACYWHFVDAVWVVIFSVVYLWTFL